MPFLYTFMPSHSFLNAAFAFENVSEGWLGRWKFVWMPFCCTQSQENPEWAPGRETFAKTLAEAGGSNLFGHCVICAWKLLREQQKGEKAQDTLWWVNVMFPVTCLNFLALLHCETDLFKWSTNCVDGNAVIRLASGFGYLHNLFTRREGRWICISKQESSQPRTDWAL